VPLAAAPAGIALVQLGPRAAENEQRYGAAPVDEVLEELDERCVGPVQILEDGDERTLECYVFEKAPPRRERLGARCLRRFGADERRQPRHEPLARSEEHTSELQSR